MDDALATDKDDLVALSHVLQAAGGRGRARKAGRHERDREGSRP